MSTETDQKITCHFRYSEMIELAKLYDEAELQ